MSRGVDKVQLITFPFHSYRLKFDSDSFLLLKIQSIQNSLGSLVSLEIRVGFLKNSVCKSGLPMVNMSDDGEIPDFILRM
jgi:hypothetical protein